MVTRTTNKIDDEIQLIAVTQRQMSRALGLGTTRINQLIDEGILIRDETSRSGQLMLFESLRNFFLSKNANLGDGENAVNFWKERGLHEKAKRGLAEVKLAKTKGELYEKQLTIRDGATFEDGSGLEEISVEVNQSN